MANNQTISRTIKGITTDLHPMQMDEVSYGHVLNGVVENFDGNGFPNIQNEPSNLLCASFPAGYKVVGFINVVEQNRVIWFLYNPTTQASEIGESQSFQNCRDNASNGIIASCDDCQGIKLSEATPLEKVTQTPCCVYRTIKNQPCFNFSDRFPVDAVEYRIRPCSLEIYFTDGNNPRRWLEFEYVNDDVTQPLTVKKDFLTITGFQVPPCEVPIYGTTIDCNKMSVQPNLSTPCIDFIDLVPGGALKAGSYQFFIAYADINGNKLSSYVSFTNTIPIRTKEVTFETDYVTDRAIALEINNIDRFGPYQYYKLAVAKTVNSFTSFYEVGTFPITQTKYTYTGANEAEVKLTEGDIFQRIPYYKTATDVTASNNILFWAGLKEFSKPNLQRVANNIILYWQTIAIPEAVYRNPRNVNKYRGYMRDEVYPFGIVFIYSNGEESPVYHIPGRASRSTDLEIINNNDVIEEQNCTDEVRNRRWQVYNTATLLGGNLEIYKECEETCYQYGEFAYWESTEKYPNIPEVWGSLCGQNIRHSKFPDSSITHIHNYENGSAAYKENNLVFPIGVKVDHASVRASISAAVTANIISAEEAARIVSYRIVRGNRFRNKSIQAKGLLFDVNQYVRMDGATPIDQEPIYFANYPYNDLRSNPFVTNQLNNYDNHNDPEGADLPFTFSNRYTFHSPDTHFNEPAPGTELKLETAEYGSAEGYYTKSKKQAKQRLLSDSAYALALAGGIVAAMLRTEEKECIEYTIRSDYHINQQDSTWDSSVTGNTPVGVVTGSSPGATATVITPSPFNANGNGTTHHGQQTEDHNNKNFLGYDPTFGTKTDPINNVDSYVQKTCKGTRNQYFNNPALNGNAMGAVLGALGGIIGALNKTADFLRVVLDEMNIILRLIESLTPYRDWTVQYHSVGKYNNYRTVANSGNKRRKIASWAYLKGENSSINEEVDPITGQFDSIKFNNWHRESSLYLKYEGPAVPNAGVVSTVTDTSRVPLNDGIFGCTLDKRGYTPISSYYASVKNFVPDQYGSIYTIDYMPTDSCVFDVNTSNDDCRGVYGGDTFINRFGLKVKVPYFLATTFGLPQGTDFNFSEYPNLAFPRHYYNSDLTLGSEIGSITDIINPVNIIDNLGRPKSIRDCSTNKFFYQNGYIYLYHYGIPYFLVESDVNVDYRHAENNKEKSYYPLQGDLDFWLQEENVPISEDNYYLYNRDYSKQNHETPLKIDGPDFTPSRDCVVEHPNRIIYALNGDWLTYKANDYYDVPLSQGRITSIEGIENETVLVRTINSASIFKAFNLIPTDGDTIQVGSGGVFKNKPQQFAETTLGYVGSQHKAILHTEYGHVWVDAKRGQVFNLASGGNGLDEISKEGMKNWFKENLPFRILRDVPNMPESDIDRNFAGLGIAMAFDKRFNRIIITKRDYKLKNKNVSYNSDLKQFFLGEELIKLGDKRYFQDVSWTVSYNFFTKTWVSFHTYKPNYYIDFIEFFGSGNETGLWLHNLTNASYQVFYGKLHPFVAESIVKFEGPVRVLNNIEFDTEVRRYQNEYDYVVKKSLPGFNKAIVYNDIYNSGLLELVKVNKNNLSNVGKYPKRNWNSWEIEVSSANYKWRFNQFYNLVKNGSEVPLWNFSGNNFEKELNPVALNYGKKDFDLSRIRGQWFKVMMVNDKDSNHKIINKFSLNNQTMTFK